MGFLLGATVVCHIIVAFFLIGLVLLQQGKGADAGASFGAGSGGASGTFFGAAGSGSFLSRLTATCVTVFFLTSLLMTYLVAHQKPQMKHSVLDHPPLAVKSIIADVKGDVQKKLDMVKSDNKKSSHSEKKT